MIEILFTFEPTTTRGYMVGSRRITKEMKFAEYYKHHSKYVFDGKKYKAYCLFNTANVCSKDVALKIVSKMIESIK